MNSPPGGSNTEIKIDDPSGVDTARESAPQQLQDQPLYRRAMDRLLHPIVTLQTIVREDADDARLTAEKALRWDAARGRAGFDITDGKIHPEQLPATRKEKRLAAKIAMKHTDHNTDNATYFELQRGTYEINPDTGLSSWRQPDGEFPRGLSKKSRKRITKAEEEFVEARDAIRERRIAIVGRDPDNPELPARSEDDKAAEVADVRLRAVRSSARARLFQNTTAERIRSLPKGEVEKLINMDPAVIAQKDATRVAHLTAGKTKSAFENAKRVENLQRSLAGKSKKQADAQDTQKAATPPLKQPRIRQQGSRSRPTRDVSPTPAQKQSVEETTQTQENVSEPTELDIDATRVNEIMKGAEQPRSTLFGKDLELTAHDREQFVRIADYVDGALTPMYEDPAWQKFTKLEQEGMRKGILSIAPRSGSNVPMWCVDGGADAEVKKIRRTSEHGSAAGIQVPSRIYRLVELNRTVESLRKYAALPNERLYSTSTKTLGRNLRVLGTFVGQTRQSTPQSS